ncbi:MAG: Uma2 family endonuclease [Caldilineaceae bacterium]|nr:Uma2 family endonuclease [Caldilineaceae bacterium]
MTVLEQPCTIIEFDQFRSRPENKNRLLELIDGEIVEKMPTEQHGVIALNIGSELRAYAKRYNTGRAGVEVRHRSAQDDRNSRLPDVSFRNTTHGPIVEQGSVVGMPDLAVEIKSPSDTITEMRETALYYLANGSRLVWLVYPHLRLIEVCRTNADIDILDEDQILSGHDVLPGFELAVADVFADAFPE